MNPFPRLSLSFGLLALLGLPADAQNLMQNGSFEQGLAHWASAACSLDLSQHHWEDKCVRLGSGGRLAQIVSGLTAGQTYYVNVWCKGRNAGTKSEAMAGNTHRFRAALPSGTYNWMRVQFRLTAEASSVPIAVQAMGRAGALWVGDVYLTPKPCVNARTLGLHGDGLIDVTKPLGAALADKRFLYLPAGTYGLSGSVTMPKGAILWGDGAATALKKLDPSMGTFLTASGTDRETVGSNEFTGIRFVGLPGQKETVEQHALRYVKVDGLLVRRCVTQDCGLLLTETNKKAYGEVVSEADLGRNVRVVFNDIEGGDAKRLSPSTGIEFRYTTDALAAHSTVRDFAHGIMWWGGDSAFGVNGDLKNPRWARRIAIVDNTVTNVGGGGIWGSMGQNILVQGNTVKTCGDVGVDLEGCFDTVADSNVVSDAHNGGLSSFFGTSNITFLHNKVSTVNPEWPLFRLYNPSVDPTNIRNVRLIGNEFSASSGVGLFDDHNGPGPLTITGNQFLNVRIDLSHRGTGMNVAGPTIVDNTLTYTADAPGAWAAINVLYLFGDATVRRNTIHFLGTAGNGKAGIRVQKEAGAAGKTVMEGNTIIGATP